VLAVFADWPGAAPGDDGSFVPRGVLPLVYGPGERLYGPLYQWHGAKLILGNAYILAGLILFGSMIVAAVLARPSQALPPPSPRAGDPLPAPRPADVAS